MPSRKKVAVEDKPIKTTLPHLFDFYVKHSNFSPDNIKYCIRRKIKGKKVHLGYPPVKDAINDAMERRLRLCIESEIAYKITGYGKHFDLRFLHFV